MAEFIKTEEKVVNVGEPVIFENNTDSDFSVSAAIVFRKSGLYDVSIVGRRTIISKIKDLDGVNRMSETISKPEPCDDCVSRNAVIRLLHSRYHSKSMIEEVKELPSVQPEEQHGRVFKGIVVEYLSYNTYPEYIGKPYFSIKYTENGQEFIGYGTYSPEVLSEYLKEYFMPSAQLEQCWIPVSEKLPEDSQFVLMTIRRMNEHYNHEPFISVGYISWNQSAWWCAHAGDCKSNDVRVDAWMPLPEPYNGDKPE